MEKQTIIVTGGAGYIGSHTSLLLAQQGYNVVVIDKLLHGQHFDVPWATLIKADFADEGILATIFAAYNVEAVMHFAALIEVGQSVKQPQLFYENNVVKPLKLLEIMIKHGIKKFIFSSSCAVYGNPVRIPMDEDHPTDPISPYGKNKLIVEYALQDYSVAYGLKYVSLRYFNAAGAFPEQQLGERHDPESHIIPLLLRSMKKRMPFSIFGNDYDTEDGSCVRDYIHVRDIADAHVKALELLGKTGASDVFNLGTGHGYSVKELIKAAEKVCNIDVIMQYKERREGDAPVLVANSDKAANILGWVPYYSSLDFILKSALRFEEVCKAFQF